ncbi:MAG TPA: IPT/TIG domain-containing protein, partial [Solirubrobacterales bacterium]|nr:IPT/TIG domain-containing protein [Solirubrobacterales bacterium]
GASFERTTTVTVSGDNFAEVSSVSVDGRPVPYTLDSMTQLNVSVPPRRKLGSVPVTVTTVAGSAAGIFSYEGCVVPKLKGKSLRAGRKALNRRLCELGEVRERHGATTKTGRVKHQDRRPGAVLPSGTKVEVTLGLDPVKG